VIVWVSRDEGKSWCPAGYPFAPDKTTFDYVAPNDGVYFFSMSTIDHEGRQLPNDPTQLNVMQRVRVDRSKTSPLLAEFGEPKRLTGECKPTPAIEWINNYADACRQAKQKKLPILLYFGASNCPYSAKMEGTLKDQAVIGAINEGFVPVLVCDAKDTDSAHVDVDSFPTTIIADASGHVLKRIVGLRDSR